MALSSALVLASCASGAVGTGSEDFLGGFVGTWHCVGKGGPNGDRELYFRLGKNGSGVLKSADGTVPFVVTKTATGLTINGTKYTPGSAANVLVTTPLPMTGTVKAKVLTNTGSDSYSATATVKTYRITFKGHGPVTWGCDIDDSSYMSDTK